MWGMLKDETTDSYRSPFIPRTAGSTVTKRRLRHGLGGAALFAAAVASGGANAAALELASLQVFASGSISGDRSDYQGTTVAGDTIRLSDFDIGGNLIARNSVTFKRGRVHGDIRSAHQRLDQVSGDFAQTLGPEEWTRFSAQLDELDQRISGMPATIQAVVTQSATADRTMKEVRIAASHAMDVVDLTDDMLRSGSLDHVRLVISGDRASRLVIRVHGVSPALRDVGFASVGGIAPGQILMAFPEARDLVIASSGGAVGQDGEDWGIPGSIFAPRAGVRLAAVRVTGQVFAHDIASIDGLPSGQINRVDDPDGTSPVLRNLTAAPEPDGQPVLQRMY